MNPHKIKYLPFLSMLVMSAMFLLPHHASAACTISIDADVSPKKQFFGNLADGTGSWYQYREPINLHFKWAASDECVEPIGYYVGKTDTGSNRSKAGQVGNFDNYNYLLTKQYNFHY